MTSSALKIDNRLGGLTRYYIAEEDDHLMQVPDEIRKCSVFVGYNTGGCMELGGTAFFVSVPDKASGMVFGHVVTAKHVVQKAHDADVDGKIRLRVNKKDGAFDFVVSDQLDWYYHPDDLSVDVAVLPLWLPQDQFDYLFLPVEMAANDKIIKEQEIGPGDEVFLTGLFVNHYGHERNLPILRSGNIALMPEEKVLTKNFEPQEAFLVESRSTGGLSGSPVFVYLGSMRVIGNTNVVAGTGRFYWLGLMHGHWDSKTRGDSNLSEKVRDEQVNMGIAIVIPVSKILEVVNQDALLKLRQQEIREKLSRMLPTTDVAATEE